MSRTASLPLTLVTLVFATGCWFIIFQWQPMNFWLLMAGTTAVLGIIALMFRGNVIRQERISSRSLIFGLSGAVVLYGIFWLGSHGANMLLPFASEQVSSVYALKTTAHPALIALLLAVIIGPGEELYWRGLLQQTLQDRYGTWIGWILGTVAYAGVHMLSGNIMIVIAALVGGAFWGGMYAYTRQLFPVILCHVFWDILIFVIIPLQ